MKIIEQENLTFRSSNIVRCKNGIEIHFPPNSLITIKDQSVLQILEIAVEQLGRLQLKEK